MKGAVDRADSTGGGAPGSDPSRRILKRVLLIAGSALGLLVLLYGTAAVLLHTLLDPETVAGWVEPRAEAALNRDVELGGVGLRIFPRLAAELQDVQVANPPDFEGPPLARVGAVRLDVAILPLFRRQIRVDEVRVEEPAIRLAVDAEGRTNYGDLVPESSAPDEGEARPPLQLAVRTMAVRDGSLSYVREPDSVRMELSGFGADASVERDALGGWDGEVRADSDSLLLGHPVLGSDALRLAGPGVEFRGAADGELGRVELRAGSLRLAGASVELSGEIEGLKEPVRRVDLAVRSEALDVGELVAALPDAVAAGLPARVSGSLGVDVRAEGPAGPGELPEIRGRVTLSSLGLRAPAGDVLADGLGGVVELAPDEVSVREVSGSVLGGPFAVDGTVRPDSVLSYAARIEARPRLETAAALATLPEGVELEGGLDVALDVEGAARRPESARFDGRVEASGLRVESPALRAPARVERARLDLLGQSAAWEEVGVALGDDSVSTTGSLEDLPALLGLRDGALARLDGEVRSAHLDLDAIAPPDANRRVTYGRIAFAHLGGRTIQGRSAAEWADDKGFAAPDSLRLTGETRVRVDTLRSAPHRLTDVRARVVLGPDLVEVRDASFGLYGGSASTRLSLGAGGGPHPFALGLDVRDVVAADFLEATSPLGRYVSGTLSLELEVAGELDERLLPLPSSLGGSGRLRIREGGLDESPLTAALARVLGVPELAAPRVAMWSAPFRVEGPGLRFSEASLETSVGEFRYGGVTGLDGGLDLGVTLALPAGRLDSLALDRSGALSAVAGGLTGGGGPVALGLSVGGTLEEPSIAPRASLVTDELRRALLGEIEGRTRTLRDTARGRAEAARDTARARAAAARDTVQERVQETRDTAAARLDAERREAEERARREAEEARDELQDRARDLLRGLRRPRDTASEDTTPPPPDGPD